MDWHRASRGTTTAQLLEELVEELTALTEQPTPEAAALSFFVEKYRGSAYLQTRAVKGSREKFGERMALVPVMEPASEDRPTPTTEPKRRLKRVK